MTKKNGIEEAVADRGQLRLEDLQLVALQRQAGDHPGDEAAEQDVEAELAGEQDEAEDEHDGDPHGELAARLEACARAPASRARPSRTETSAERHGDATDEGDQDRRLVQRDGRWRGRA